MTERPATYKAVRLIAEDNGATLLPFYDVVDGDRNDIVEAMHVTAASEFTDAELDQIEAYLAGLSDDDLEEVTQGDSSEMDVPEIVLRFLELAFETDLYPETEEA